MKTPDILQRLARDQRSSAPEEINLISREARAKDIAGCHALHRSLGLPYAGPHEGVLPEAWQTLLSNGTLQLFVIEDRTRQGGSRLLSYGATVFVTDVFCSEAKSTLPPYLWAQLTQHHSSQQSPVLRRKQVACANAGAGVNVVMCFGGCDISALSREDSLAVREKQSQAWCLALRAIV